MGDAKAYGLVLAAGAGTRFGGPKVLARDSDGVPWVQRAVAALQAGGCDRIYVALGAQREAARVLVPDDVRVIDVPEWSRGVSASVGAGLRAIDATGAQAVVICPVDTPDLPPRAVQRLRRGADATTLAQATYRGAPGHPVVIGRAHWRALGEALQGDRGAGPFLRAHNADQIECGDLWSGADIDSVSGADRGSDRNRRG